MADLRAAAPLSRRCRMDADLHSPSVIVNTAGVIMYGVFTTVGVDHVGNTTDKVVTGISGHGKATLSILAIFTKTKKGACNLGAAPKAEQVVVDGSGPVLLP